MPTTGTPTGRKRTGTGVRLRGRRRVRGKRGRRATRRAPGTGRCPPRRREPRPHRRLHCRNCPERVERGRTRFERRFGRRERYREGERSRRAEPYRGRRHDDRCYYCRHCYLRCRSDCQRRRWRDDRRRYTRHRDSPSRRHRRPDDRSLEALVGRPYGHRPDDSARRRRRNSSIDRNGNPERTDGDRNGSRAD